MLSKHESADKECVKQPHDRAPFKVSWKQQSIWANDTMTKLMRSG